MGEKAIRSPQEKKALSLKKDCRNTYGNNQKAARKSIPLRKAIESRRTRHKDNQALALLDRVDEALADLTESSIRNDVHRAGGWRKGPDEPLGAVIERANVQREQRHGRKIRSRFAYHLSDAP
jgi:hypothetical protein